MRRTLIVFTLALPLLTPANLLDPLWSFLSSLGSDSLTKAGCGWDPNGLCKAGCGADPDGLCKEGGGIDPDGLCKEGGGIDPNGGR